MSKTGHRFFLSVFLLFALSAHANSQTQQQQAQQRALAEQQFQQRAAEAARQRALMLQQQEQALRRAQAQLQAAAQQQARQTEINRQRTAAEAEARGRALVTQGKQNYQSYTGSTGIQCGKLFWDGKKCVSSVKNRTLPNVLGCVSAVGDAIHCGTNVGRQN